MYVTFFRGIYKIPSAEFHSVCDIVFDCCCKIITTTTNLTILDCCGIFLLNVSVFLLKSVSISFVFFFKELSPCTWQQHVNINWYQWHHISVETTNRIKYALLKYLDFFLLFDFSWEIRCNSFLQKRNGRKCFSRETIAITWE